MPFSSSPRPGNRGGGGASPAAPGPVARGAMAATERGKRRRKARRVDPRPRLGRGWSEAAWPRRPAGGGGPGPVSWRHGGGQGKGKSERGPRGSYPLPRLGLGRSGGSCPRRPPAEAELSAEAALGARGESWERWWSVLWTSGAAQDPFIS